MRQLPTTDLAGVLAMNPCWVRHAESKALGQSLVQEVFLAGGKTSVTALDIVDFALAQSDPYLLTGEDAQWVACHILPVDLPVLPILEAKHGLAYLAGRGEWVWAALPHGDRGLQVLREVLVAYMESR